jgi:hypothetical protein
MEACVGVPCMKYRNFCIMLTARVLLCRCREGLVNLGRELTLEQPKAIQDGG